MAYLISAAVSTLLLVVSLSAVAAMLWSRRVLVAAALAGHGYAPPLSDRPVRLLPARPDARAQLRTSRHVRALAA